MIHKGRASLAVLLGLAWIAAACTITGLAQEAKDKPDLTPGVIKGVVKDASGGVLLGTHLEIPGSALASDADNAGSFSFKEVPPGTVVIRASLTGFTKKDTAVAVKPGQEISVAIVLELETKEFTVTVEQAIPKLMSTAEGIGITSVQPSQLATLPSLGEKDIFRSLQLMPGVSATNEASSGLYVRGGTPDQNLILFDGFTVYNVDHFFGIFSAFNSNAVESITMHKGGFESQYGGRISSVVELTGKEGGKQEYAAGGGISFLSYNAYFNGPIGKKANFMFAGRRSYPSPLSKKMQDNYSSTSAGPGGGPGGGRFATTPKSWFYDLNGRITYSLSSKDTLTWSAYFGPDDFDDSRTISMPSFRSDANRNLEGKIVNLSKWGNSAASMNWQRNWTSRFTSNLTLSGSRYFKEAERTATFTVTATSGSKTTTTENKNGSTENNRLDDITARWTNTLVLTSQHLLEFGAEANRIRTSYGYNFNDSAGAITRKNKGLQYAAYLQDRWRLFKKLEITPGLRASRLDLTGKIYLEPRLSVIAHVTENIRLKAAGGRYHQFINNLTREDPMQGDRNLWTLADNVLIPVSASNHYIGGASYETNRFLFDVEAYRKELRGLMEFGTFRRGSFEPPRPGTRPTGFDFTKLFFSGTGRAEGVEFLGQKKFGENTGWITYTLGRIMYNFSALSSKPYPASHDSKHEVKIVDSQRFRAWTFSGIWVFATGKPFTEPTGYQSVTLANGRIFSIPTFGDKNGIRLPDYHRLDLSATWDFYQGEGSQAQMGVSVFNSYKHANVWKREYNYVDGELLKTDVNYLGLTFSAFLNVNMGVQAQRSRQGPAWVKQDPAEASQSKRREKPFQEYDFYGNVVAMQGERLSVQTKKGTQDFLLFASALKGEPYYEDGAYVHVYYKQLSQGYVITRIFRKVL